MARREQEERHLVLDETEITEVFAALEIAAQVNKTVGNHVMATHYSGLIATLTERVA